MQTETIALPSPVPGTTRHLVAHRFGTAGARPKAYVQGGLHGDELPGVMAAHALVQLLAEADARGEIAGEVVVVPVANPIGLSQQLHDRHLGRHDFRDGLNFNRNWPDLTDALAEKLAGKLGGDAAANVALIRATMLALLAEARPEGENATLRHELLSRAIDADFVLDLHCDLEAANHLYCGTALWPDAADLAAEIGSCTTLLAEVSGGNPFDEASSSPWWLLAARFPEAAIPAACLAATVEYRGLFDLDPGVAEADAAALFRFLQRRRVIAGDPGPLPPLPREATPLAGVAMVRAATAGVARFNVRPGDAVTAGQLVVTVTDPLAAPNTAPATITAPVAGVVYAHVQPGIVRPGEVVIKIAGTEKLPERTGKLLSD